MNKIEFKLEKVYEEPIIRDGISFTNIAYVDPIVDGCSLFEKEDFTDSFFVYSEFVRSLNGSGKYLLFTCACGVADDSGWNGVIVTTDSEKVNWEIDRNTYTLNFSFELNKYKIETEKLKKEVESLDEKLIFAPRHVNFPEEW